MIQSRAILAISALFLLVSAIAQADTTSTITDNLNEYNRPGAFGLTVDAGQLIFDSSRNLNDKVIPQAGLTYDIDNHFAIEAMFSLLNTNQINSGLSVHGSYYTLNGLLFLEHSNPFQPYLTAGVGALNLNPNGTVNSANPNGNLSNFNANVNFGAGFQLFFNRNVALQIEGKALYTPAQTDSDFLVNGGLTFLFGSHPTALSSVDTDTQNCQPGQNFTVEFEKNSAYITNSSREMLNNIAACLSANPTFRLNLTSLTSVVNAPNNKQNLISKRSKVVTQSFINAGISAKRINTHQIVGKSGSGRTVVAIIK